jgi:uncharacterized membrane protein
MGLIYAITFAVLTWLVLWALGWKATDATIIASGIILVAVMATRVASYLPGRDATDASGPQSS